ncbi:MAG: hypothetical protein ACFFB3_11395 [Candidatus Hodarchaeota archaeon]
MAEEPAPTEEKVLNQLKASISRFIERIGQEVQQLHQTVETIQREIHSSQAKTDMQIVELSSRLSNLENAIEGLDSLPDESKVLDALPERKPVTIQSPAAPTPLATPVESVLAPPAAESRQLDTASATAPASEGEKKEEKRELLKALQLIDSL